MGLDEEHDYSYFRPPRSHYDLNSKIMLAAVVSLSAVVIFVTVLHVYVRCVLQRQARRRAIMRDMNFIRNASQIEATERGLDPSVITSLPTFVFKHIDGMESSMECSICLCTFEDGEVAKTLPNCNHNFHAECIDKWFGLHSTCPVCRAEAKPRLESEPREGLAGPTALPFGRADSALISVEGPSSQEGNQSSSSAKLVGSSSRLSSFRRILSRERSSRRLQSCGQDDGIVDLERQ